MLASNVSIKSSGCKSFIKWHNVVPNTLEEWAFHLTDVKASTYASSQADHSNCFTYDSMFNNMCLTIGEKNVSGICDKRADVTTSARECANNGRVK